MLGDTEHLEREAPLVVVPSDDAGLPAPATDHVARPEIDDDGRILTDHVREDVRKVGGHVVITIGLEPGEQSLQLLGRHLRVQVERHVERRTVESRHPPTDPLDHALKRRQNDPQTLSGTGRRREGVDHPASRSTLVIPVCRVRDVLRTRDRVDGRELSADDLVVGQHARPEGSEGVGGARRVGDEGHLRGDQLVVHAVDDRRVGTALRRAGDEHAVRSHGQELPGLRGVLVLPAALEHDVDFVLRPRDLERISICVAEDAVIPVDPQFLVLDLDLDPHAEPTVDAVQEELLARTLDPARDVDGHEDHPREPTFQQEAADQLPDAPSSAVHSNSNFFHGASLLAADCFV